MALFSRTERVRGLVNDGNSCFLNALLQSLSSISCFFEYLTKLNEETDANNLFISKLCYTLLCLNGKKDGGRMDLRELLPMVYKKLKGDQQDAQEWFHFFLEAIDHCRSQLIQSHSSSLSQDDYSDDLDDSDEPLVLLPHIKHNSHDVNDDEGNQSAGGPLHRNNGNSGRFIIPPNNLNHLRSLVMNGGGGEDMKEDGTYFRELRIPFMGSLESHLQCTACLSHTVKMEGFFDIPLSIEGGNSRTLEELLISFIRRERISDFHCESCSRTVTIEKWMTIGRLPNCLCITIRRNLIGFGGQSKINKHIQFPQLLNISYFVSNIAPTKVAVYKLRSLIEHHGGVDGTSGHYTTIRSTSSENPKWYYISDEMVREIDENKLFSASAYMLFYELQK